MQVTSVKFFLMRIESAQNAQCPVASCHSAAPLLQRGRHPLSGAPEPDPEHTGSLGQSDEVLPVLPGGPQGPHVSFAVALGLGSLRDQYHVGFCSFSSQLCGPEGLSSPETLALTSFIFKVWTQDPVTSQNPRALLRGGLVGGEAGAVKAPAPSSSIVSGRSACRQKPPGLREGRNMCLTQASEGSFLWRAVGLGGGSSCRSRERWLEAPWEMV